MMREVRVRLRPVLQERCTLVAFALPFIIFYWLENITEKCFCALKTQIKIDSCLARKNTSLSRWHGQESRLMKVLAKEALTHLTVKASAKRFIRNMRSNCWMKGKHTTLLIQKRNWNLC